MWTLMRDGYTLMQHWPVRQSLLLRFPLTRQVMLGRWLLRWLPGAALVWLVLLGQLQLLQQSQWLMVLVLLSLPVQALLLLGKQAAKPLSGADLNWFNQIQEKMQARDIKPVVTPRSPRYLELGRLMEQAFKLDAAAFSSPE